MKLFLAGKKPSRAAARNAMLLNQLATPGLGSLVARHWLAGAGQLGVFLAGFVLFIIWFIQMVHQSLALLSGNGDSAPPAAGRLWLVGIALASLSWCWSLVTSLQIMRDAADAPGATPPTLNSAAGSVTAAAWQKNGEVISRTFVFTDFPAALNFVNAVAQQAEQVQHHPDIDIRWNKVTLALTTHDAGGLTDKDYSLALVCDEIYNRH